MNAIYPDISRSIWTVDLGQPPSSLLQFADLLLASTGPSGTAELGATLHAFNPADGVLRWQQSFEHTFVSGLAIAGDTLLVSLTSTDLLRGTGALLALDIAGETRYRWAPEESVQRVSAPAVTADAVCFTVDAQTLVALDPVTGEERGRIPLGATASLSAPALVDDVAYVPCRGPHLLAVRLDGEPRWHFTTDGPDAWLDKTPVVLGKRVFAACSDGAVVALDRADGALAWRVDVGPAGKSLSPLATDDDDDSDGGNRRLYVGARDGVHALDPADGRELWHFSTGRRIQATPIVTGGVVYAAGHDHHVYALDAITGRELWRCAADRRIEISPALAACGDPPEPGLIIADRGGTVAAVERPLSPQEMEALASDWRGAAEAYVSLGCPARAAEVLERYGAAREAAEQWRVAGELERAAVQYEAAGAWEEAAELWCALGRPLKQAQALEAYARSLDETVCPAEDLAAAWETAAQSFYAEGEREQEAACRREIARCLRLPIITLDVDLDQGLVRDAWTRLRFIVRNEGFGPARNLVIRAQGEQFAGQVMATQQIITLRAGQERVKWLDVRPQAHGDSVPLRVRADYEDRTGEQRFCQHTIYIPVARDENARSAGQTINVFVSGEGIAAVGDGAVAAGGGSVAVGGDVGGDVTLDAPPTHKSTPVEPGEKATFLRRQLAEARENLRLIEERKAAYVLQVDVPLQLIKEERHLRARVDKLARQVSECTDGNPADVSDEPTWATDVIRDLLSAAFSDEELTTLCFDYFRPVYEDFGAGMSKGRKIQRLLDYCVRHDRVVALLDRVRERNPVKYARFEDKLGG